MTDEMALAAADGEEEEAVAEAEVAAEAPVPAKRAKDGSAVQTVIIAVLATLLLIVVGLFITGRIVFLPPGVRAFHGGPGGGQIFNMRMAPEGGPPTEEHLRQLEEQGATIRRLPDGGVMVGK